MASYYLMMDVGGTGIKVGIFDQTGQLLKMIKKFPSYSKEDREIIFTNFANIIETMGTDFLKEEDDFCGIGMAFPGPFDYVRGISLMKGLDKYDDIYGIPLSEEILKRVKNKSRISQNGCPFLFLHDVEAFALGESRFGAMAEAGKLFCLCIGTGAGSAFVKNGQIVKNARDIPENGWIYNSPYKEGVIDDYISVQGLKRCSEKFFHNGLNGAELYKMAIEGEKRAIEVFHSFGDDIMQAIKPFLLEFHPDALVFGGQISKSFPFFGGEIECFCSDHGIQISITEDTSKRAMEGLYIKLNEK